MGAVIKFCNKKKIRKNSSFYWKSFYTKTDINVRLLEKGGKYSLQLSSL